MRAGGVLMRAQMLSWIVVVWACARSNGDDRVSSDSLKRSPAGAASATTTAQDAGSPDSAAPTCADLSAAFQARLAAASGACATAADCACFTSIVDSPACAGVTDAASARALNDQATRFRDAGCRLPRQCGPGRCAPQCVDHRCR
jgi:hypothetical protein